MKPWQNPNDSTDPSGPVESDPLLPQDVEKNFSKEKSRSSASQLGDGAGAGTDEAAGTEAIGLQAYMSRLEQVFGRRFLVMLMVVQHMLKGFVMALADAARPFLYKSYHVSAPQVQIFNGVATTAWAVKPVIGLLSDMVPIGGKNKAPYMIMATIVGAGAFVYVGVTPHASLSVVAIVVCVFLQNLQGSTCDLLTEAKYAEKIQQNPAHGPDMLTFVWMGVTVATLLAIGSSSFAIEAVGPQHVYLICAVPAMLVCVPLVFGYMDEQTQTAADVTETRRRFWEQSETGFLCVVMLVATLSLSVCGLVITSPYVNCLVSVIVGAGVLVCFSVLLSPTIAKFNAFALIQTSFTLSISGATFYFFTDTPEQYPEGPHFSTFFYTTVMGVGGALMSIVGLVTYRRYFSSWSYRSLLVMANCVSAFLSLLDLIILTRANVRLGIPDRAFILGNGALETMIGQWQWMPQVVILSYMCPEGMEATMYALLAGCHNLGATVAGNCGALLLHLLECQPSGKANEGHQFENLWQASLISTVLPLAVVLFLFQLIPAKPQDENLLRNNSATSGSLWQRFRGHAQQDTPMEARGSELVPASSSGL